ncbi:MAG TPA: radical SAM protein, partial [Terriglobales bacterium]
IKSKKGRLAFLLISKIYRQMYADTGIATDSARTSWSARWARWLALPCQMLFAGRPEPQLQVPPA